MRKSDQIHILIIILLFSFFGCTGKSEMKVTRLQCENQEKPLGIGSQKPRLSWQMESSGRNVTQSAYRVLVSESVENLEQNKGEVWDSKKVKSDQSVLVSYAGKELQSGKQYFWKVRVWDSEGKASSWSETGSWTMGLLKAEDWEASWVGSGHKSDTVTPYAALEFRKEFLLEKKPVRAVARFSGLGFGELSVNGEKVSKDKMAPGWTDYRKKVYYLTYDDNRPGPARSKRHRESCWGMAGITCPPQTCLRMKKRPGNQILNFY
ncbi:MAG: alpha-L-rhamnosidase N-terminal domain-containing protein [Mangrovibacterium sp.]